MTWFNMSSNVILVTACSHRVGKLPAELTCNSFGVQGWDLTATGVACRSMVPRQWYGCQLWPFLSVGIGPRNCRARVDGTSGAKINWLVLAFVSHFLCCRWNETWDLPLCWFKLNRLLRTSCCAVWSFQYPFGVLFSHGNQDGFLIINAKFREIQTLVQQVKVILHLTRYS